jgi:hypothetical protein
VATLWPCTGGVGQPKAATMGQTAGLWPSRPLWPWAAVRPRGIVDFSIFLWNYLKEIQIHFGLNLNMAKFVQTGYLNEFDSSLNSSKESELGFQIQLDSIKPLENTHRIVNSLEIHSKFYGSPKNMKLRSKFIIFPDHLIK